MAQLRQLNLQLPFMGACTLGENIKNQAGAVDNATLAQALKITFLSRGQRMIKKDNRRPSGFDCIGNLNGFTFTNKILWVRRFTATGNHL